jgi:hypothetical protein
MFLICMAFRRGCQWRISGPLLRGQLLPAPACRAGPDRNQKKVNSND